MAITVSIVGIFVKVPVKTANLNPTVKDVLNELKALTSGKSVPSSYGTISNFNYTATVPGSHGKGPFVTQFTVEHTTAFESRSCHKYHPGVFTLAEYPVPGADSVWQYYVLDASGKAVQLEHCFPPEPKLPGDPQPSFAKTLVPDGGQVIWRLVSILTGPTSSSPHLTARL